MNLQRGGVELKKIINAASHMFYVEWYMKYGI